MSAGRKRNPLAILVAFVVAAGAIAAIVAASGGGHARGSSSAAGAQAHSVPIGQDSEIARAARYLGLAGTQVQRELRSGLTLAQIADATRGKSAAGLITALVTDRTTTPKGASTSGRPATIRERRSARLRRRIERQVGRVAGYVGLPAVARYLGSSLSKLDAELQAGRSLAQIAEGTPGKSVAGLIGARVRTREAALKAALASGKLDETLASALLSSLRARVTSEVQKKPRI